MIYFRRILFLLCMIPVLMLIVFWVMAQFVLIPINSVLSYIIKGKFTDKNVFEFIVEYLFKWVKKISPDYCNEECY
jgi:hypothetical protein